MRPATQRRIWRWQLAPGGVAHTNQKLHGKGASSRQRNAWFIKAKAEARQTTQLNSSTAPTSHRRAIGKPVATDNFRTCRTRAPGDTATCRWVEGREGLSAGATGSLLDKRRVDKSAASRSNSDKAAASVHRHIGKCIRHALPRY